MWCSSRINLGAIIVLAVRYPLVNSLGNLMCHIIAMPTILSFTYYLSAMTSLLYTACLQELKAWLTNNFLHLNDDKTQIILFSPNEKTDLSTVDLGSFSPYYSSEVKDLGFILDNDLKLNKQINSTVSSFYHQRRLAKVKLFLK